MFKIHFLEVRYNHLKITGNIFYLFAIFIYPNIGWNKAVNFHYRIPGNDVGTPLFNPAKSFQRDYNRNIQEARNVSAPKSLFDAGNAVNHTPNTRRRNSINKRTNPDIFGDSKIETN